MTPPLHVYYSFAQQDAAAAAALDRHLALLKREGLIESWDPRCLLAGDLTQHETERRFTAANVIFILLSADFTASDACFAELDRARRRQQAGDALVRLVLVRPVDCDSPLLRQLPTLPRSGVTGLPHGGTMASTRAG